MFPTSTMVKRNRHKILHNVPSRWLSSPLVDLGVEKKKRMNFIKRPADQNQIQIHGLPFRRRFHKEIADKTKDCENQAGKWGAGREHTSYSVLWDTSVQPSHVQPSHVSYPC